MRDFNLTIKSFRKFENMLFLTVFMREGQIERWFFWIHEKFHLPMVRDVRDGVEKCLSVLFFNIFWPNENLFCFLAYFVNVLFNVYSLYFIPMTAVVSG